jgi:hypothetical protein
VENLKNTPAGEWGGSLATDGMTVWAGRGGATKAFWIYTVATNLWTVLTSTLNNITTTGSVPSQPPTRRRRTRIAAGASARDRLGRQSGDDRAEADPDDEASRSERSRRNADDLETGAVRAPTCTVSLPNAPAAADVALTFI